MRVHLVLVYYIKYSAARYGGCVARGGAKWRKSQGLFRPTGSVRDAKPGIGVRLMSSSEQIKLGSGAYGPSGVQGQSPWPSCNKKKGGPCGPPFLVVLGWISNLEIHVAHAATRGTAGGGFLLRLFGDHRFRGDQQG